MVREGSLPDGWSDPRTTGDGGPMPARRLRIHGGSRGQALDFHAFFGVQLLGLRFRGPTAPVREHCGKAQPCHTARRVATCGNNICPFAATFDGRYWARTSDPQLVELVLSQLS